MKLRFETVCHSLAWHSQYLTLEVRGSSDIRDRLALDYPPEESELLILTNLSFIFLLLGVCRTGCVTCEAIERQSPTDS